MLGVAREYAGHTHAKGIMLHVMLSTLSILQGSDRVCETSSTRHMRSMRGVRRKSKNPNSWNFTLHNPSKSF